MDSEIIYPSHSKREETDQISQIDALESEINGLELLITLQLLHHRGYFGAKFESLNGIQVDNDRQSSFSVPVHQYQMQSPSSQLPKQLNSYLIERMKINVTYPATECLLLQFKLKSAGKGRGPSILYLPAVLGTDGHLHVYSTTSDHIATINLGHSADTIVSATTFDGSDGAFPLLVSGGSDGSVHITLFEVSRGGRVVAGLSRHKQPADNADAGASSSDRLEVHGQVIIRYNISTAELLDRANTSETVCSEVHREDGASVELRTYNTTKVCSPAQPPKLPAVTKVMTYYKGNGRGHVIIAGDALGRLHVRRWEGTGQPPMDQYYSLSPSAPVSSLSRLGQIIAVAAGREVRFFHIGKQTLLPYSCLGGSADEFHEIKFDPRGSLFLYVLTRTGTVLVYNTRSGTGDTLQCSLVETVAPLPRATSESSASVYGLTMLRGHLLRTTNCELQLFNISAVAADGVLPYLEGQLPECMRSAESSRGPLLYIPTNQQIGNAFPGPNYLLALVPLMSLSNGTRTHIYTLSLLETLVPAPPAPSNPLAWMKIPMVLGGILLALLWRYAGGFFGSKRSRDEGRRRGGRGKDADEDVSPDGSRDRRLPTRSPGQLGSEYDSNEGSFSPTRRPQNSDSGPARYSSVTGSSARLRSVGAAGSSGRPASNAYND